MFWHDTSGESREKDADYYLEAQEAVLSGEVGGRFVDVNAFKMIIFFFEVREKNQVQTYVKGVSWE